MTERPGTDEVLIRRVGRVGHITLNRPSALNAITLGMVRAMRAAVDQWIDDPDIAALLIDGAGERGLCAGGDIRALYDSGKAGDGMAMTFWREEYELDIRVARFPKPVVALMDGIVMGGGVGVSAHASHRIVTESTRIAMPECGIGFMPDVGGTWLLSSAPGAFGPYLGLTGTRMKSADAIYTGFADTFVARDRVSDFVDSLTASIDPAAELPHLIAAISGDAGESALAGEAEAVNTCFGQPTVEGIIERLEARGDEFAIATLKALDGKSPTSLKVALRSIRTAGTLPNLESCLDMEYRFAWQVIRNHDFFEGVRAVVIDKDQKPKWRPAVLTEVSDAMVDTYFRHLGDEELGLWPAIAAG